MPVDPDGLHSIAAECVPLVLTEYGLTLDWELDSLQILDDVCQRLVASGLSGERVDLWWKLVGAYTGEVIVAAYGGPWIEHDQAPGSDAVLVNGVTGFPSRWQGGFSAANRSRASRPSVALFHMSQAMQRTDISDDGPRVGLQ